MKVRTMLGAVALCQSLAGAAVAAGAPSPLTLGDFGIGVLGAAADLKLQKAKPGRTLAKETTTLTLENKQYDKPYSVSSDAFVRKYAVSIPAADLSETYAVFVSSPQSNRIVFRVDRGLDYPNALARPRLSDVAGAMVRKWGDPNNGGLPKTFKPGETVHLTWFFRRDGSKYDRYGGCEAIWQNGTTLAAYGLELREPVARAGAAECDGYVSAEIAVDDDLFVKAAKFSAYSNQALDIALKRDFEALDKKLDGLLDKTVTARRRILPPPKL